jgi:hypothetical protein
MTDAVTDAEQKARIGQMSKASDRQEQYDIQARDEALAARHPDCRYFGFVTVTVTATDRDRPRPTATDRTAAVAVMK